MIKFKFALFVLINCLINSANFSGFPLYKPASFRNGYSGTSNNSLYLGGTLASGYQTTAGLSANIAAYLPTYAGVINSSSINVGASFIANTKLDVSGTGSQLNVRNSGSINTLYSNNAILSSVTILNNVSALNVTTNGVFGGNVQIDGNLNVTGNIAAGNISDVGSLSVTGNATVGNLSTAGQVSATFSITAEDVGANFSDATVIAYDQGFGQTDAMYGG